MVLFELVKPRPDSVADHEVAAGWHCHRLPSSGEGLELRAKVSNSIRQEA